VGGPPPCRTAACSRHAQRQRQARAARLAVAAQRGGPFTIGWLGERLPQFQPALGQFEHGQSADVRCDASVKPASCAASVHDAPAIAAPMAHVDAQPRQEGSRRRSGFLHEQMREPARREPGDAAVGATDAAGCASAEVGTPLAPFLGCARNGVGFPAMKSEWNMSAQDRIALAPSPSTTTGGTRRGLLPRGLSDTCPQAGALQRLSRARAGVRQPSTTGAGGALACTSPTDAFAASWVSGQIAGHPFELDLGAGKIDTIPGQAQFAWCEGAAPHSVACATAASPRTSSPAFAKSASRRRSTATGSTALRAAVSR
jgi:hypothetical protein